MSVRNLAPPDTLPDHLARWLEAASRRLHSELRTQVNDEFPELRGSHRRILQMIPGEGIRITDLAAMAQMTKQALGEFADWLERSGFVRSQRDDTDRRVRRLFRTDLGDKAADATQRADRVKARKPVGVLEHFHECGQGELRRGADRAQGAGSAGADVRVPVFEGFGERRQGWAGIRPYLGQRPGREGAEFGILVPEEFDQHRHGDPALESPF